MKNKVIGNAKLLDRVCYISRPPSKYTDIFGKEITVQHTFPYNPDSKTSPTTAKHWATLREYDHKNQRYIESHSPEPIELKNDPFTVTIVDLDVRSEGGRAYKVIDEQNRCFDLREDQVLQVFKHVGISPGGKIPGEFVWGIQGSQVRMTLVYGDSYNEMLAQDTERKRIEEARALKVTPTESTLQFGHIYQKRDKSLHMFLGKVKAPGANKLAFAFVKMPDRPPFHDNLEALDILGERSEHTKHLHEEHAVAQKWDTMTWTERCDWWWYGNKEWLHRFYKDQVEPGYYYSLTFITLLSSPKLEEDVGEDVAFAEVLRKNENAKHHYDNGYGDNLPEKLWEKEHNNGLRRDMTLHVNWNLPAVRRQEIQKQHNDKVKAAEAQARADFRDRLQWL